MVRLLLRALGQAADLLVDLVVGHLDDLGVSDGAQRQIDLHGLTGGGAQLFDELGLTLAGRGEVLLDSEALCLEAHAEVLQPGAHLVVDECLGRLVVDQLAERRCRTLTHRHLRLHRPHDREPPNEVGPQRVERLEL